MRSVGGLKQRRQAAFAFAGDGGAEQRRLAGEMLVDRALGNAGGGRDHGHAGAFVAARGKDRGGAVQDGFTLVAGKLPFRSGFAAVHDIFVLLMVAM